MNRFDLVTRKRMKIFVPPTIRQLARPYLLIPHWTIKLSWNCHITVLSPPPSREAEILSKWPKKIGECVNKRCSCLNKNGIFRLNSIPYNNIHSLSTFLNYLQCYCFSFSFQCENANMPSLSRLARGKILKLEAFMLDRRTANYRGLIDYWLWCKH